MWKQVEKKRKREEKIWKLTEKMWKQAEKLRKRRKKIISIAVVNEQARSQRLSYGQLVAREWMGCN